VPPCIFIVCEQLFTGPICDANERPLTSAWNSRRRRFATIQHEERASRGSASHVFLVQFMDGSLGVDKHYFWSKLGFALSTSLKKGKHFAVRSEIEDKNLIFWSEIVFTQGPGFKLTFQMYVWIRMWKFRFDL